MIEFEPKLGFEKTCSCGYISYSKNEAIQHEDTCSVVQEIHAIQHQQYLAREQNKMLEQNQEDSIINPSCFCSDIAPNNDLKICHKTVLMRNRKNRMRILALDTYCGRWDCSYCGSKLKEKWEDHINYLWEVEDIIFRTKIKPNEWVSIYAWIRRHGGNYIRIKEIDGSSIVFSTVSPGTWEMIMGDKLQQETLQDALLNIEKEHKPISTSRKWKLSTSKRENKEEWERIDVDLRNKEIEEIRKVFEEEGLRTFSFQNVFSSWYSKGLEIIIPEDRFDEMMEKIEQYSDPYCVHIGKNPYS